MTAARKLNLVSIDDDLAGELVASTKHAYVAGVIYAMAGGTNSHGLISSNVSGTLYARLRGGPCRAYKSYVKIRVRFPSSTRFYYPDASVVCRSNASTETFQDAPVVIVEVMSRSTRRIDDGEKRDAYLTLGSLAAFVLVEQDFPAVLVYRREGQSFTREVYEGVDAIIPLPEIGITLPLVDIYEAVEFPTEPKATED